MKTNQNQTVTVAVNRVVRCKQCGAVVPSQACAVVDVRKTAKGLLVAHIYASPGGTLLKVTEAKADPLSVERDYQRYAVEESAMLHIHWNGLWPVPSVYTPPELLRYQEQESAAQDLAGEWRGADVVPIRFLPAPINSIPQRAA